ncbi:hypothetical protein G6F57_023264 [Rhizopus arrhizus]|nr:hypothetical protein G6F57_023264 [Rhizopus arrhizus]
MCDVAVDGAARDVLHRHPCLPRELLGDGLIDKVPEAAAPGAYHQGILRMRRAGEGRAGKHARANKFLDHDNISQRIYDSCNVIISSH